MPEKWKIANPNKKSLKNAENTYFTIRICWSEIRKNNRVVDLALNQAAKPWFHQYLDPVWYHLWRIVSENVFRGQICNLE